VTVRRRGEAVVAPPQPWAASGWQAGPVDVGYRYPAGRVPLYTSFKPKHREGRASAHCHVPCGSGPCLPTEACSDAFTCLTALNPASLLGRALVLPCVTRLRTPPPWLEGLLCYHMPQGSGSHLPARDGSGAVTCHMAPDLTSLFERASVLPHAPWLRTLPPCLGGGGASGLWCCHMSHDPQRAVGLKNNESLSCNDMQQDSRVFKTRPRGTEVPAGHVRRQCYPDLQTMWIGTTVQHRVADHSRA
jgi:hypothetical protein